ncbi:MAG: hypothetical protein ABI162_08000 [Luteolibacter sp.]
MPSVYTGVVEWSFDLTIVFEDIDRLRGKSLASLSARMPFARRGLHRATIPAAIPTHRVRNPLNASLHTRWHGNCERDDSGDRANPAGNALSQLKKH